MRRLFEKRKEMSFHQTGGKASGQVTDTVFTKLLFLLSSGIAAHLRIYLI